MDRVLNSIRSGDGGREGKKPALLVNLFDTAEKRQRKKEESNVGSCFRASVSKSGCSYCMSR